jgi:hypothetical protein
MYCTSQMQQIMVHELAPPTCMLLQIFIAFYSPMLLLCTSSSNYKICESSQKKLFLIREKSQIKRFLCEIRVCVAVGIELTTKGEAIVWVGGAKAPPKISKISYSDQIFTIYTPPWHHSMHPQGKCTPWIFSSFATAHNLGLAHSFLTTPP